MIGVLGASGRVGQLVARALADHGAPAISLLRHPEHSGAPLRARYADLDEPESLRLALVDVERLFLITASGPGQRAQELAAIQAAVSNGVRRIVKVSGGAPSLGPNGVTATAVAHWHSEQAIERSGLGFTFLRPSFYLQNLLDAPAQGIASTGVLAAPFGRAPIAMIDVRDVAACAAAALLDLEPIDRAWHLTGPRPISFDAIARHLGVPYLPVSGRLAGRVLARRGATAVEVDHAVRMAAYFAAGSDGTPTDHVFRLTGSQPRAVEAFLDEHASSFAPATRVARAISRLPISKDGH